MSAASRLPHGLSAFPLTPLRDDRLDRVAFVRLIERLVAAEVNSITVLGSTGSYPYLDRAERADVARLAVQHAGDVPVLVGVGALRTAHVLQHVADAQDVGADGVLLAPVSYQALTDEDVYGLYQEVTAELSVPLVVYDNPSTTHVDLTDDLYRAIGALPQVASVKIPGLPEAPAAAAERVQRLRALLPSGVSIGISGDAHAATGLLAGCEIWYSVIAGTVPEPALAIIRMASAGDAGGAMERSARLRPLWDLFADHGSLRVVAAIAEELDLVSADCLPRPIRGLGAGDRAQVAQAIVQLGLG